MDGAGGSPSNEFRIGRYNRSPAAWEANPVRFDMDAPDSSLYMDGAGKVGIGTSTPTVKLDVNGEIKTNAKVTTPELCLNGDCKTNWPSGGGNDTIWTSKKLWCYSETTKTCSERYLPASMDVTWSYESIPNDPNSSLNIKKSLLFPPHVTVTVFGRKDDHWPSI